MRQKGTAAAAANDGDDDDDHVDGYDYEDGATCPTTRT